MNIRTETYYNTLTAAGVEKGLALTAAELLSAEMMGLELSQGQRGLISQAHQQILAARAAA